MQYECFKQFSMNRFLQLLIIVSLVFLTTHAYAHGMSEAEKQSILHGGNLQYLKIGAIHMLTGFDHLLFVFGIVFFLSTIFDVIKYITAFTVGHSITLITATLMGVTANYFLINAVIALSVCYIGYKNLGGFKKIFEKAPSMIWVVFIFGLIHGFGLSTPLQQLSLGDEGIVWRILSFNLGVELGQIAALCVMVAILYKWKRTPSFQKFSNLSNNSLIYAGAFLFLFQMHGYSHAVDPDEFSFPEDNHFHAHEKMDAPVPGSEYLKTPKPETTDPLDL